MFQICSTFLCVSRDTGSSIFPFSSYYNEVISTVDSRTDHLFTSRLLLTVGSPNVLSRLLLFKEPLSHFCKPVTALAHTSSSLLETSAAEETTSY